MDDPVEVAQRRPPQAEVLDRAADAGDRHHVALAVLVLDQDQGAVQIVADEALGAEPDGDPDNAQAGDRRSDVEIERAEDHDRRDEQDEEPDHPAAELVEGVHPLLDLDGRQLLGRSLRRLAVEEGLEDAVDDQRRDADGDEGGDEDDEDPHAADAQRLEDRAQRRSVRVHRTRW